MAKVTAAIILPITGVSGMLHDRGQNRGISARLFKSISQVYIEMLSDQEIAMKVGVPKEIKAHEYRVGLELDTEYRISMHSKAL
ncbi:hypothetical protein [Bradyrhizobium sp. RDI18]|uniref:hypothetical protein n=1 Tax=Bradyrhizobium sp. RDI18 TaxID=3367400 RepID=UPI0037124330